MRLALLTSASGWRCSGASFAKLTRGLTDRGHAVALVTASPRLTERLRAEGLEAIELPLPRTGLREARLLYHLLRRAGAEAIMADTPRDLRLAVLASLPLGTRVVYRYNLNYRAARYHFGDRLFLRRASACVYQSEFIRRDAIAGAPLLAGRRGYVVPNGYDVTRFAPDPHAGLQFRSRHGIAAGRAVVLTGAKLARDKGHEVAFEALARLLGDRHPLHFVVCGDGARDAELRAMAAALGVPTTFTGLLTVDEMVAAYNAADVVVHPARREIFPNAVAEAMACGRPVVAVDDGGTPEVIGESGAAGVLVPADDPASMADAIRALLDDRTIAARIGAAARQRIEREFPLGRMLDGYERALAEVIGARRGGG